MARDRALIAEAMYSSAYRANSTPTRMSAIRTPQEAWHYKKVNVTLLINGCTFR